MEYDLLLHLPHCLHRKTSLFPNQYLIAIIVVFTISPSKAYNWGYGEASYWEKRYMDDSGAYDWYHKYPSFAPLINLYVPRHHRILSVGCGNSEFSDEMVGDGYESVVNIDISSVVIRAMKKKYSHRPQLEFLRMDVRDMTDFESGSFDTVIDKGTLDAIMCGKHGKKDATNMLNEIGRVLKDNGLYILVTYGSPKIRMWLFTESQQWMIKLHVMAMFDTRNPVWELTKPVPLNDDGSIAEATVAKNSYVLYIYVCKKIETSRPE